MGRHPLGDQAMTAAERQRRRRAKSKISGDVVAQRSVLQEPIVTREMLPLSAQAKVEAVINRERKLLERQFAAAVQAECRKAIEETILPSYAKSKEEYDTIIKLRRGMMTSAEYALIRACLHPDKSFTEEKRERAWGVMERLEIVFLNEKDRPTTQFTVPNTYEDLMAMKRKTSEARKKRQPTGATAVAVRRS